MTIQIAVKLPAELVDELDRLVEQGMFANRSQAMRRGIETMVTACRHEEVDRRYHDAMTQLPETRQEIAEATRLAVDAIHNEPWERWW